MSSIQDKLKQLKEQEDKLKLEQLKVEFLKHIEESVVSYNQTDFASVKDDVVQLVKNFVAKTIGEIEGLEVKVIQTDAQAVNVTAAAPQSTPTKPPAAVSELSPGEKMNFALDNRHLAGKKVQVINKENIEITGEVVGLDAPYVHVKTTTGPIIKVPLANINLV